MAGTNESIDRASLRLAFEAVSVARGGVPVIQHLSASLPPGASLAVVGESGCGKSTLLTATAGLLPLASGRIVWRAGASAAPVAPRTSFVWQNLALFPWKRVRDNLTLPLTLAGADRASAAARAEQVACELGLADLMDRWPVQLSGGQRQRLAIGRAMMADPDVILMDEPFSALDAMRRERLQDTLEAVGRRHGTRLVLVTHDISEAAFLCSHVLLLGANPFRKIAMIDNPAFEVDAEARRSSPVFFETVRRIHGMLSAGSDMEAEA